MKTKTMKTKTMKTKTTSQKGTVEKYAGVIDILREFKTPTKLKSQEFSKKHNVSTNLIHALNRVGYLTKSTDGYQWNQTAPNSKTRAIAEKARIIMNELTNKVKPTYERPSGKRAFNGRKGPKNPKAKKTIAEKPAVMQEQPAKRAYTKQTPTPKPTESVKVRLARKFAALGYHQDALDLLD